MNKAFLPNEMNDVLKHLRDRKSPGPDKVSNEMLKKNLGNKAKQKLLDIFNQRWKLGSVPQS